MRHNDNHSPMNVGVIDFQRRVQSAGEDYLGTKWFFPGSTAGCRVSAGSSACTLATGREDEGLSHEVSPTRGIGPPISATNDTKQITPARRKTFVHPE